MPDPLPMLRPGQAPTAREWNALVAHLADVFRTLSTAPGAAGTGISVTAGGLRSFQVRDLRQNWHWGKIGAGSGANYAHTQALAKSTGFEDLPASSEFIWGTATHIPARERNGNAAVPAGAYVRLYPNGGDGDPGFVFEYVPGADGVSACTNCDWLAGMGRSRCLRVTVAGVVTALYLSTTDGRIFTSADLLTICGTDYTVIVAGVSGGMPQMQLTVPGSGGAQYFGMLKCCGCAYATWAFNLQSLCPDEADTGSPCSNTLEVRVDNAVCRGTSCDAPIPIALDTWYEDNLIHPNNELSPSTSTGAVYYCLPVTAGTYRIKYFANGPTNDPGFHPPDANMAIFGSLFSGECGGTPVDPGLFGNAMVAGYTEGSPFCYTFTVPSGIAHLCILVRNVSALYDYNFGFRVESGAC